MPYFQIRDFGWNIMEEHLGDLVTKDYGEEWKRIISLLHYLTCKANLSTKSCEEALKLLQGKFDLYLQIFVQFH